MPSSLPVTAVFDIGKTNKKFVLFDEEYAVVHMEQTAFDLVEDDDGHPCEDLDALTGWIRNVLLRLAEDRKFQLRILNFTTYGATLVHLDENGEAVTPLYDYLKPYPEELERRFYATYGGRERFSLETASPPMGMLNSGKQLFWLKHRKAGSFEKIRRTLHFPQYLSYLFTGRLAAELTSIGCHTALWDFPAMRYHSWVRREGLQGLLPELRPVSHVTKVARQGVEFGCGIGLHDSSAALAPWLYALKEPFLLLSTGTWNITFNPFSREPLTFGELERDCLCYLNVRGERVKASRVFSGSEYAHQREKLRNHFGIQEEDRLTEPDPELLKELTGLPNPTRKLQLETAYHTGPYPSEKPGRWNPGEFPSYATAYHQLVLDLVSIQAASIRLVEGSARSDTIVVTGGFGNNAFFVKLLASRFPERKVFTASKPHAAALGAALVTSPGWETRSEHLKELLGLKRHMPLRNTGVERYSWEDAKL